jgi:hypothetical protein
MIVNQKVPKEFPKEKHERSSKNTVPKVLHATIEALQ